MKAPYQQVKGILYKKTRFSLDIREHYSVCVCMIVECVQNLVTQFLYRTYNSSVERTVGYAIHQGMDFIGL